MNKEKNQNLPSTGNGKAVGVVVITYLIAFICLVLGLCLPIFPAVSGENVLLALCIPNALVNILGGFGVTLDAFAGSDLPAIAETDKVVSDTLTLYPVQTAVLLYALLTVIALIFLVAVLVCAFKKKLRPVVILSAIVEVFTVLIFTEILLAIPDFYDQSLIVSLSNFPVVYIIALGGSLLALGVNTLVLHKGSGVMKIIAFLLSSFIVLAFFNLKLYGITVEGDILGLQDGFLSYLPLIYLIQIGSYLIETGEILTIIITILAYVIVVVAYLNFVIDLIGLNVATKRSHRVLSFIRFVVMFVLLVAYLLIALIGSAFYFKMVGAIFYLTFILAFLQVAVAVIRLIAANRARAKAIKEQKNEAFNFGQEETVESEEQTTTQTVIDMAEGQDEHYDEESDTVVKIVKAPVQEQAVEPAETVAQTPVEETSQPIEEQLIIPEAQSYEVPAEAQSAAEAQPAYAAPIFAQPAQEPAQTNATPNNNFIYHYTGDKFINTLNTVEKAEFARLFLENKTPYNNVPTYVIGGNNEKFFSSIFIYLGKFRGILSDGLINKIYMQINLLH